MKLCNYNFYNFFETLPDNSSSLDELFEYIENCILSMADIVKIGRYEIKFDNPETLYPSSAKNRFFVLYNDKNGYGNDTLTSVYPTYLGGTVTFNVYSPKNYIWDQDDKDNINFFSHIISILCDKTELIKLMHNAHIQDAMTGVGNSVQLNNFLSLLYEKHQQSEYTILFFSLKNFRYLNQTFGTSNGNIILRQYAQRMNSYVLSDETFCRLGGDNFITVIKSSRLNRFLELTSTVRLHINLKENINTFDISSRIGIYPLSENDTPENIITNITSAINVSKQNKLDDLIYFSEDMIDHLVHEKQLSESFFKALDLNEFFVCYQPIINVSDNKTYAYEALVRWNKNGETLYPNEFIPIFERESTICILDFYVLECVCRTLRKCLDAGTTPARTFLNFSKIHLHNKRIVEDIVNIIKSYDIDTKYIGIELTENCCYEDFDVLTQFIRNMKKHGIYTAINDFGTGYSSITMLSDLETDIIKLHNSFISNFNEKKILIKTVVNFAQELNMKVICEGVETTEQADFINQLNCPMAQGFYYSKPLSQEDFIKTL